MFDTIFSQQGLKRKGLITMGALVLVNILVWIIGAFAARKYPSILGSMALAYTLGLRHAVDADHLAAIDNVTRKLMYQQSIKCRADEKETMSPPMCVGLFFSLGHSTIVIIASVALAVTATAIKDKFKAIGNVGGIIGTSVSAAFLFLIGGINLFVLVQVIQELRRVHRTGEYRYQDPLNEMMDGAATSTNNDDICGGPANKIDVDRISVADEINTPEDEAKMPAVEVKMTADEAKITTDETKMPADKPKAPAENSRFQPGGLFARIFRPLFNLIDRSWKMYPLGILFGLGFDTATEVGLLGIAASNAQAGFPMVIILIFPALFTAGMSLIDTLDGIIMVNAYGWAFVNPVKKLWYNLVVTLMGVIIAFVVGFAELMGLLAQSLDLGGPFWTFFSNISDNLGVIGYMIVGVFVVTWAFAVLFYKYGPIKDLENRVVIVPV